jgi:hypothetical protein
MRGDTPLSDAPAIGDVEQVVFDVAGVGADPAAEPDTRPLGVDSHWLLRRFGKGGET